MRRPLRSIRLAASLCLRVFARRPFLAGYLGTFLVLLLAGVYAVNMLDAQAEAVSHARDNATNLVSVIGSDISRNVELYDLSLQAAVEGAQDTEVMALPAAIRDRVLFDRTAAARYIAGIAVVDRIGTVIARAGPDPTYIADFHGSESFDVHRQNAALGLYVSHPYVRQDSPGRRLVALSRRINRSDGSFAGAAIIEVRVDYFRQLINRIDTSVAGSVFIIRTDSTLLVRQPYFPGDVGKRVSPSPTFKKMLASDSGFYSARSPVDGVARFYTFAHIAGTPLIAVVAPAESDVTAGWRQRAKLTGALVFALSAAFVCVCWLLAYGLREKEKARRQLMKIATSDSLTGLGNRRSLDYRLEREWRRSIRQRSSLGILFIDIDHFKSFNDCYGHAAGDLALVEVAKCINASIRRPSDISSRYGGEEFVVVLPETGSLGAERVAESIRRAVEALEIPSAGGDYPFVTVSIGFASLRPSVYDTVAVFIETADGALYKAKREGRNRVVAASSGNAKNAGLTSDLRSATT